MGKYTISCEKTSTTPRFLDWDTNKMYPFYDAIPGTSEEFCIDANNLDEAHMWLLENHPECYFSASIVSENKKDFMIIAVASYYENIYSTNDRDAIIEKLKVEYGRSDVA